MPYPQSANFMIPWVGYWVSQIFFISALKFVLQEYNVPPGFDRGFETYFKTSFFSQSLSYQIKPTLGRGREPVRVDLVISGNVQCQIAHLILFTISFTTYLNSNKIGVDLCGFLSDTSLNQVPEQYNQHMEMPSFNCPQILIVVGQLVVSRV